MSNETPKKIPIASRVIRGLLGALPGIGLGLLCYLKMGYSPVASSVVGALASLVGIGLAQPDVSKRNVLVGTAGVIAAKNAPASMRDEIIKATLRDDDETK